jgi:hypothetical protein
MHTGYPVIVVVVAETVVMAIANLQVWKLLELHIGCIACMMTGRNNEMKYLIAIYF